MTWGDVWTYFGLMVAAVVLTLLAEAYVRSIVRQELRERGLVK